MNLVFDHNGRSFSVAREALVVRAVIRLDRSTYVMLEGCEPNLKTVVVDKVAIDDDVFHAVSA